ncbi:MAG: SDR family NAD(P)-dependent oxidoreductase [Bacteroidales bacterium]|jgi:NAD(P)-dependent dehydrogenase (short-subunit alcohol dehydrogenase family)
MAEVHKERYSNPLTATISGITDLFRKQENTVSLNRGEKLNGKNVLITGASSGLGFEAAVQLAQRGARVWMACRSGMPEKGEKVKELSGNKNVEMLYVDLSDMDSISNLLNELKKISVRFDVIICNAAVVPAKSRKTSQGIEEMFMVNYLAKYLLVRLLIETKLLNTEKSVIPRIIFVSSESHRNPKVFDWQGFGKYKEYSMAKTVELYGYYKLLMTTFANELSRRLNTDSNTRCSVFALCPGPVNTNIAREAPNVFKPLLRITFRLFFRSPEKAVKPVLYFACSGEVEGKAIDYLFLMSRKEMDHKAVNKTNGRKLWEKSEKLLKNHGFVFRDNL